MSARSLSLHGVAGGSRSRVAAADERIRSSAHSRHLRSTPDRSRPARAWRLECGISLADTRDASGLHLPLTLEPILRISIVGDAASKRANHSPDRSRWAAIHRGKSVTRNVLITRFTQRSILEFRPIFPIPRSSRWSLNEIPRHRRRGIDRGGIPRRAGKREVPFLVTLARAAHPSSSLAGIFFPDSLRYRQPAFRPPISHRRLTVRPFPSGVVGSPFPLIRA